MSSQSSQSVNIKSRDVRSVVGRAQHKRQLVIFIIQQLFALNIGMVYLSSTQASLRDVINGPGPIIYGAYVAFSIWCLYRSSRMRLSDSDVAVSVVLDYALYVIVMVDRTSSEFNGGVELSGSPLFTYVYLFIAMRSLHYKAGYVYMAGGLAALAWLALLWAGSPGGIEQLVEALRGHTFAAAVLSGAVDKLLSIMAVTALLGLSVREARKHLYASAIRGAAGKNLARMVGQGVANQVLFDKEGLAPGRGRKQVVAILMIDIQQFTKMAAKADPSEIMALLARYHQLVEGVIVRSGGCIDKFMGDGILAHFGAIEPSPGFAANAMRCVESLIHETEKWNRRRHATNRAKLTFRVSCAIGEAVVGLVGGATKVEFTVIGDPVNLAAKLEKHAKKLQARGLTTADSFRIAKSQGFVPRYPTREVAASAVGGVETAQNLVVLGEGLSEVRMTGSQSRSIAS
jgi:adenylate cyclase